MIAMETVILLYGSITTYPTPEQINSVLRTEIVMEWMSQFCRPSRIDGGWPFCWCMAFDIRGVGVEVWHLRFEVLCVV